MLLSIPDAGSACYVDLLASDLVMIHFSDAGVCYKNCFIIFNLSERRRLLIKLLRKDRDGLLNWTGWIFSYTFLYKKYFIVNFFAFVEVI